jgi:hypothetical protein
MLGEYLGVDSHCPLESNHSNHGGINVIRAKNAYG